MKTETSNGLPSIAQLAFAGAAIFFILIAAICKRAAVYFNSWALSLSVHRSAQ